MSKRKQPYRFGVPAKYLAGLSDAAARKEQQK